MDVKHESLIERKTPSRFLGSKLIATPSLHKSCSRSPTFLQKQLFQKQLLHSSPSLFALSLRGEQIGHSQGTLGLDHRFLTPSKPGSVHLDLIRSAGLALALTHDVAFLQTAKSGLNAFFALSFPEDPVSTIVGHRWFQRLKA